MSTLVRIGTRAMDVSARSTMPFGLAFCAVPRKDKPTGNGPSHTAAELTAEAINLMNRSSQAGDARLLARALAKFRLALDVTPLSEPDYEVAVDNLAHALIASFELTG